MTLKLKRNLGLPLLLAALACALILGVGDQRIYAYGVHSASAVAGVAMVEQSAGAATEAPLLLAEAANSEQALH